MARSRTLALALALVAAIASACSAPTIATFEEQIVVPERVSTDAPGTTPAPGDDDTSGTPTSSDTTGAPAGTPTAPPSSPPTPPPPPAGAWMQANGQECGAFCSGLGKANVTSADGAKCTSGENIPASAVAAGITYDQCYPSCNAHVADDGSPVSVGKYCYSTGQKHDDDASDVTRGCFCK